eukprot:scaffold59647_cov13-Prasinocladus_malaysianus.AAC.1
MAAHATRRMNLLKNAASRDKGRNAAKMEHAPANLSRIKLVADTSDCANENGLPRGSRSLSYGVRLTQIYMCPSEVGCPAPLRPQGDRCPAMELSNNFQKSRENTAAVGPPAELLPGGRKALAAWTSIDQVNMTQSGQMLGSDVVHAAGKS